MAVAMKGLRLNPKYEDPIGVAVSDKLYNVKMLNHDASFLRNGFVLSQLDGEGARTMERQEMASKESYKEHILKQIAQHTGANTHDLRNDAHQDLRSERVENALHFGISQDDDDVGMTQTVSTGVQAEARTASSGTQSSTTQMDEFGGTQAIRIKTKEKGNQAIEDRSEEIEKLTRVSELAKQAPIDQHTQNVGRIRQQGMTEADTAHDRKKQEYQQEALEQLHINEADAQRRIQQVHQQAQQEAQQYLGSVVKFAEQAHLDKLREQKNQNRTGREGGKRSETNINKQQKHNITLNIKQHHLHPIKEEKPKQKPDFHQRVNYLHFPLVRQHLEVKINQNMRLNQKLKIHQHQEEDHLKTRKQKMIIQNRHMSQKAQEEDHQIPNKQTEKEKGPPPVNKKQTPKDKTPNMTPSGSIVSQRRTGTSKSEDMLLISCLTEDGSGRD